ncbi:hypothetical protein ACFL2Y_03830 [Candidatus Omnitrophota bacterium]
MVSVQKIDYAFEQLAAKFVSRVAKKLPDKIQSLAFTSPLSARSPDLCMLWHVGYRKKNKLKLLKKQLKALIVSFTKLMVKRIWTKRYYSYARYGNPKENLLVAPSTCAHFTLEGDCTTHYVQKDVADAIFVFGTPNSCGKNEIKVQGISFKERLLDTFHLLRSGIVSFLEMEKFSSDTIILLMYWLVWIFELYWMKDCFLEKSLSEIVCKYKLKKIGCIHEMHSYARIVWRVAKKYRLSSYTIQHASISSGKRWYFTYPEEKESGLILPLNMFVYNKRVQELLKPFFPNTNFRLGCSSRYAFWKNETEPSNVQNCKYYLFVGALANFDNDVLLHSVRKLLTKKSKSLPIRIRLHPFSELSQDDKQWLKDNAGEGKIELSRETPLKTDLLNSIVVIGMSTTVLEEALILGRPVIQITHPEYLEFIDIEGIKGVLKVNCHDFSFRDLCSSSKIEIDSQAIRKRLGLYEKEITYQQLFS